MTLALHQTQDGLKCSQLYQMLQISLSTDWQNESRSVQRLLKHLNCFGRVQFVLAVLFCCFYAILNAVELDTSDCLMWTLDVEVIGAVLYPWHQALFNRPESFVTMVFMLLTSGLSISVFYWLGWFSHFGQDQHASRQRRIYDGLLLISVHNCQCMEFKCLNHWAANALSESRYTIGLRYRLQRATFHFFHVPFSLLISLPKLGYTFAQNVESSDGVFALCNNSVLVVIFSLLIETVLLRPVTHLMVRFRNFGMGDDELKFNRSYVNSLFMTKYLSHVFWPTLLTFLLDENWSVVAVRVVGLLLYFACT